jgi:AcrR family transcriptional regulator
LPVRFLYVNERSFFKYTKAPIRMNKLAELDSVVAPAEARTPDLRVDEILMQARHAFVEKGFDGASMQDLARAAGMSAGNFYRYFPSKAALVEALVNRDLEEVEREFAQVLASPRPIEALRNVLEIRLTVDCEKDMPLWAEIMAAAARKPEIAMACGRMEVDITHKIVHVLSLGCGVDPADGAVRFAPVARLILLLVRGAAMQNSVGAPVDHELNSLILKTIDRLIDDVTSLPAGASTEVVA